MWLFLKMGRSLPTKRPRNKNNNRDVCQSNCLSLWHTNADTFWSRGKFSVQNLCKPLSIDKTRTTSFKPQSNGNVERFHRTLATMLTIYIAKEQNIWDEYLSQIMMAYRSSKQSSTDQTPNILMLGREITLFLQVVIESPK